MIEQARPDIVQVGAAVEIFSAADTRALKAEFPRVLIMRSIPVVDDTSIEWARAYQQIADFLLLDSHDPGDRQIGALGRPHDWSISRRIVDEVGIPAILAGGLGAENVGAAIAAVRPAGVDSKTKTDRADGIGKDLEKVRRFRRCGENHHRKAVARSSTAPLFWMTPNNRNRHCRPGVHPKRRSLSALSANRGS